MKKKIFVLLLTVLLFCTSCQMEEVIPAQSDTFSLFYENEEFYRDSVEALLSIEFDALISRNDFYAPDGSENFTGLYIQNMEEKTFSEYSDAQIDALFINTDVKLIDKLQIEELSICAFDMCVPGHNFDYGIYYVSEDKPVYFGDPSINLNEKGNGFSYEKPASYGTKFTYYTEKITDHYYYYEIM